MTRLLVLFVFATLIDVHPAHAQQDFQNVSFFYPLRTRRPVIERELELSVEHTKTAEGRTTEAAAAIELPILPRWQIELEVPIVFNDPRGAPAQTGLGDSSPHSSRSTMPTEGTKAVSTVSSAGRASTSISNPRRTRRRHVHG